MVRATADHVLEVGRPVFVGRRAYCKQQEKSVLDAFLASVVNSSRLALRLRWISASRPGSWIGISPLLTAASIFAGVDIHADHMIAGVGQAGTGTPDRRSPNRRS